MTKNKKDKATVIKCEADEFWYGDGYYMLHVPIGNERFVQVVTGATEEEKKVIDKLARMLNKESK